MRFASSTAGLLSLAAVVFCAMPARALDLEKFFPKETDAIITLNVRQILDSDLIKKFALSYIQDGMKNNKELVDILKALDFDPLADLDRVTMGLGGEDQNNPKVVAVMEGKFDAEKFNTAAGELAKKKADTISVEKVDGKTVYKITGPNQPTPMFASVINSKVMVLATSKDYISSSFSAADGAKKSELRKELAALYSKADSKASMTMVADVKGKTNDIPVPDANAQKVIATIESITLELRLEKDVKLELTAGTTDDEAAKSLNELLDQGLQQAKQFVPLIAIQNPQMKPLGDMINNLKNTTKGKLVKLNAELPRDAIDAMMKGEGKK